MLTLFCTALTSGMSYPRHCPSMLMQFSMISPAPKASHTYRYDTCDACISTTSLYPLR